MADEQPWLDHPVPDPMVVQRFLDWAALELATIGPKHEQAIEVLADAEDAWELLYDPFVTGLRDAAEQTGRNIPGEDVRKSMCRERVEGARESWQTVRKAKGLVKIIEKRQVQLQDAISARQSTLRQLRAEAENVPRGQE